MEGTKVESQVKSAIDGDVSVGETAVLSRDEQHLAKLGYKQEFFRHLGLFENWSATFTTMNFVSGMPVLFGFAMYTGGPQAAFANWTMIGGLAVIVSLAMAEIAAAFPTAGGIYFWSYSLGGHKYGRFLSWMTAWWNWAGWICVVPGVQQGATNFLLSALEIKYPDSTVVYTGWFSWLLTALGMIIAMMPNVLGQRALKLYFRFAVFIFFVLFAFYWIWFPAKAAGKFQSREGVFDRFYNGINEGTEKQASDSYAWVIGILFGAWEFYGYDASAHLAEETHDASDTVAKGMWAATVSAWVLSVPDFDGIVSAEYTNNWAEYLIQLLGENGATAVLVILWVDSTCATASCFMSAQRVTFAISRDGVLPFSRHFRKLNKNKVPVNAAYLVLFLSVAITCAVIGSTVAFSAITATATIATNVSYLFPIAARHTIGRHDFKPAHFNLGKWSVVVGTISCLYIVFQVVVLVLPQLYPVTAVSFSLLIPKSFHPLLLTRPKQTLNYAPICIGIVTVVSLVGWILPFGLGGRYWFRGPKRTLDESEGEQSETT